MRLRPRPPAEAQMGRTQPGELSVIESAEIGLGESVEAR